ncbi:SDR family NAD(P)-dependent oxidoreductase [Sphingoaurantiacus capsulatus]|uniref:SDR family NAD(P)-dependent oxidoreductase n=1 Tax=Sphingoaurantiacus capsulatus TaxID=1771310 RepID=A0ABV7X9R5_9SPHN
MQSLGELCALDGQVAVVTGAATGIGAAVARRFAAAGARLFLIDLDEARLVPLARDLGADWQTVDVSDWAAADRQGYSIEADILVNCAGLYPSGPVLELDEAHWDRLLDVNLKAVMRMTQQFGRGMVARGRGAIVNIASVQALRPTAGKAAYAASKAGVVAFTQVAARELAPAVRVNAVAPGPILTEAARNAAAQLTDEASARAAKRLAQVPLGRMGDPDEVARVVQFLASPAAAFVTGATWTIDGGVLLG